MPLGPNSKHQWGTPGNRPRACLWIPVSVGSLRWKTGFFPSPSMTTNYFEWYRIPREGESSMDPRGHPSNPRLYTHSRDKILSYHLPLALISDPEEIPYGAADRAYHHLTPNTNPTLCLQNPAPEPSRMGPLQPHSRTVPALLKKTLPVTAAQTLLVREKPTSPLNPPQFRRPLWTKIQAHPENLPTCRHPGQWP